MLPFINSDAILNLAKCHDLTLNILQGTRNWMKRIKRSCPFPDSAWPFLELDIKTIKNLAGILDDEVKGPRHTFDNIPSPPVAEVYPGNVRAVDDQDEDPMVQLDCPHPDQNPELCDEGHHVRFSGFLLLEEVEGTFDTALQNVLTVHTWDLEEPRLSALASRISRQQKNVAPFKVWSIKLQTEKSAEAFKTFMKICPKPV